VPENILVIKPSSLGDVVHSLPVLAKLRSAFPDARISWLIGLAAAPLIESNPNLDRVIYFHRRRGGPVTTIGENLRLARALSRENFDCVIDLQGLLRSALFARATRAPRRVGLSDAREGASHFYSDVVAVNGVMHAIDRYLKVGEVLGFDPEEPVFSLEVPQAAHRTAEKLLEGTPHPPRPFIAFSPGARWHTKVWPRANFIEAGRLIIERFGGTILLVGTVSEAGDAAAEIENALGDPVVNLVGRTTLEELVAVFGRLDLLVTPDTGLMHIADAIGLPLVAVFGPTDPARTGPYFQRERVLRSDVCPESPCLKRRCDRGFCDAMQAVSGEEVFRRVAAILEGAE
jgi:lipopolysaccharide heptosyltransferase I